jgi:two-component system, OmpR family, phosphate regulon sensor histidine kinase PhoR
MAAVADARLTMVDEAGRVVLDTEAEPAQMENHRDRPEFRSALEGQDGWVIRPSPTIGIKFLYVAVPLEKGALRLAVPLSEVEQRVDEIRRQAMIAISLAFLPAILIAAILARTVSAKLGKVIDFAGELARGNFHARLKRLDGGEIGALSRKLNDTGEKLEQMFEQLQREHAELEKLERVRKDFVINVSHELRTPLASIQGYAETLLDGALDDPANNRHFLNIIRQNTERLTLLTADLMTLSNVELNTRRYHFTSYSVHGLLQEACHFIQPLADKKQIRVNCDPVAERAVVFCDAEAVHQILSNLLENAVKYTPEGGSIHVGARHQEAGEGGQNGPMMELFVEDTGMGIPEDELPRLFERFYRVDKARSRALGGTGLGLSIVKHLVRAHGGDVRVESRVHQGSRFSFTLPVEDPGGVHHEPLHSEFTAL